MPDGAHTLIIGNPLVADVTMLKSNRLLVVTGKSFGTTNLILLDETGARSGEQTITVTPADRTSWWSCAERGANPTPARPIALRRSISRDDKDYSSQVVEAIKLHESSSAPAKR